jgi:dolichol-phosphate mannosyltransferase
MFSALYERFGALLRFLVSGGSAAAVLLLLLYVFTDLLGFWYLASSIVAFLGAFVVSFTLHKFWTFADPHLGRAPTQAAAHFTAGLINLGLNTTFLYILVDYAHIHYLVSQILVSSSLAVVSFFVYKHLIFRRGRAGAQPEL